DHTRELDQHAVAGGLDDAAAVLGYCGVDQVATMGFEPRERAFLVLPHRPAVARDVGRQDRRQPALDPFPVHRRPPHLRIQLALMLLADQSYSAIRAAIGTPSAGEAEAAFRRRRPVRS